MTGAVGPAGGHPPASNAGAVAKCDPPALPPTVHPRPDGAGWRLLDYVWAAGVARLEYRQNGSGAKRLVHQLQPANESHAGWDQLPGAARRAKVAAAAEGLRFRPARPGGYRGPR